MGPHLHGVKWVNERAYVQTPDVRLLGMLPVGQFSFTKILFSLLARRTLGEAENCVRAPLALLCHML